MYLFLHHFLLARYKVLEHIPSFFGLADMQFELEEYFNRTVDLRTPNDLSKNFREEVVSNAFRVV